MWDVLGRGRQKKFNLLKTFAHQLYQKGLVMTKRRAGQIEKSPVFSPYRSKNKKVSLFIAVNAISYFINRYQKELLKMGFKKEKLTKACDVLKSASSREVFLKNRLLTLSKRSRERE